MTTPTDPNPAREADGRADREALWELIANKPPEWSMTDWLLGNRVAVLRALNVDEEALGESVEKLLTAHREAIARAEAAEAELERLHSWQGLLELLDDLRDALEATDD